jgi:hypothetical protein
MSSPKIRLVQNKDIDRAKWDRCIACSPFGIAYAYSWYLDRICQYWDALIADDYLFVMPLVNNSKYGISYIYQPFFSQQLGIFSKLPVSETLTTQFLKAIPPQFRLADLNLNLGNVIRNSSFDVRENTTYHLSLKSGLHEIQSAYHTNTRRNIQRAIQNKLTVTITEDIDGFLVFTKSNLAKKAPEVKPKHYSAFKGIIRYALANKLGEINVVSNERGEWLSAVFFLKTNRTCIYLAASSNHEGTEKSAMFLLIDSFIQKNAGCDLILDFEGSNIQGVARFYAGFGASPQTYFAVHINRLPWPIRLLKS